jgi:hypothetical protein
LYRAGRSKSLFGREIEPEKSATFPDLTLAALLRTGGHDGYKSGE